MPTLRWLRAVMKYGWRRVLLRPCELCGDRRRCWRWHVEIMRCPTCGTDINEFHPRFGEVTYACCPGLRGPEIVRVTGSGNSNPTKTIVRDMRIG